MIRGFKICKGFEDQQIQLPQRSTKHSAGYDFQCAQTVTSAAHMEAGRCRRGKADHGENRDQSVHERG